MRVRLGVLLCVAFLLDSATPAEARGWRWLPRWYYGFTQHSLESPERILHPLPISTEWMLRSTPDAREVVPDPFDREFACWRIETSRDRELADLVEALQKMGTDEAQIARAKEVYSILRDRDDGPGPVAKFPFQQLHQALWRRARREQGLEPQPPPAELPEADLALLPEEFRLYFAGARSYWSENVPAARASWEQLLKLPAGERQYRTTWALWMLGKTEDTEEKALAGFRKTRMAVEAGFADSLRLSEAADRWIVEAGPNDEVRLETIRRHFRRAIGGSSSALMHLRWAVPSMEEMEPGSPLETEMLSTRLSRLAVLAVWAHWQGHVHEHEEFFDDYSVDPRQEQSVHRWIYRFGDRRKSPEEQTLLAIVAYRCGDLALTRSLLSGADKSPDADWLRAKLAIHERRPTRALPYLERARPYFEALPRLKSPREINPPRRWAGSDWLDEVRREHFLTDLGVIRLAVDDYAGAAAAFIEADNRFAVAHVLQNLFSREELVAFVRERFPDPTPEFDHRRVFFGEPSRYVRRLAGAKLAAHGDFDQAREFFDPEDRRRLALYREALRLARDEGRPAEERAESMWRVAQMRRVFRNLFAVVEVPRTRLPDDLWPAHWRLDAPWPSCLRDPDPSPDPAFLAPTEEEFRRLRRNGPLPAYKGFPRYDAAKLAQEAAEIAGPNTEAGARYLWVGGSWVKHTDPLSANRYYRELVRKFPETIAGRKAKARKWFPAMSWPVYPSYDPTFVEYLRERGIEDL